ncbi:MAG TPA: hypothetical protein VJ831_13540 [Jatrophihabitantaceae bacterium]|nr:hypothetical protein [Jatrophihabitantaceae bacterium]
MSRLLICGVAAVAAFVLPMAAAQARTSAPRPGATPVGNDISYPQCGRTYPSGQAFAIVGVNGGKASTFNNCFGSEVAWAQTSSGASNQPRLQLYVNTGNPGDVLQQYNVTDWPTTSVTADPYGSCSGTWQDTLACSWEYGYERATADINAVNSYLAYQGRWWLDIETANSWTSDFAKNQATLEGMVYALQHAGNTVGIYASSGSWSSLFGPVGPTSALYSLDEWRPGAKTLSKAQSDCALAPFEGNGKVTIAQYVANNLDYDYSCA